MTDVEKGIVSVPIGNVVVPSDSWADSIDGHEAVLRKRRPPELVGPLVDMGFSTLSGRRGGEQHVALGMTCKTVRKNQRSAWGDMFCNFKRLHEVELPAQIESAIEICGRELILGYPQIRAADVLTINAVNIRNTTLQPRAKPGARRA